MGTLNKDDIKNPILLNILSLCSASVPPVSASKMCNDLGLSRSLITKLRNDPDRLIAGETAIMIAEYFGVSVACVLGMAKNEQDADMSPESKKEKTTDTNVDGNSSMKDKIKQMSTEDLVDLIAACAAEVARRQTD